ncbi:hypothetical protein M378DRAFT_426268 [Amanita muscaria Koide BX008]|uniref:Uncharacterized protein n=1 Tax=Amanita muscaria (strain Koide BX008) TaxID=946122 RepID=A0A0C2TGM6_AMAMK|nr:hypothetical protein M378DRAFT_426268 [Amanita muscaria Koide BX008]
MVIQHHGQGRQLRSTEQQEMLGSIYVHSALNSVRIFFAQLESWRPLQSRNPIRPLDWWVDVAQAPHCVPNVNNSYIGCMVIRISVTTPILGLPSSQCN